MNSSRATRKYERLLFKGIPEQPEPSFERDQYSYAASRLTGMAQALSIDDDSDDLEVLGTISYDFENQVEKFTPSK